ncbi:MAG: 4Fe-4S cluster-binding domain-containing protein [bacterium]
MITHKGIEHEIINDAPFVGAIITAPTCSKGCKNCINEHLKYDGIYYNETADEIIEQVKNNKFNEGIILAGLEWTESESAMKILIFKALYNKLKVILYTHQTEKQFKRNYPELYSFPIWVKFGSYKEDLESNNYFSEGVKLATTNQYIKFLGE